MSDLLGFAIFGRKKTLRSVVNIAFALIVMSWYMVMED